MHDALDPDPGLEAGALPMGVAADAVSATIVALQAKDLAQAAAHLPRLPPAPRRTPTWALWVMGAIVVGGLATPLGAEPAGDGTAASTAFDAPRRRHLGVPEQPLNGTRVLDTWIDQHRLSPSHRP